MALISKKRQLNRDRISNLPDNLITHILSFLSTKDAVRTSVLSTSWNQQWTLVPVIRFDDKHRCSQSFVNFVYRVLLYKVAPLDLFQLMGRRGPKGCYDAIHVKDWISVALSRHVRHLDVNVCARMPSPCCLPDSLYSSKTLVVLKLKGKFVFRVPEKISLVSLKILHYEAYNSMVSESFTSLIPSCPVLEELQIRGQLEENVKVLNISSVVLKRLILRNLYPISKVDSPYYELVLNTPNLQYLEHYDNYGVPDSYHLNALNFLDTARFSLNLWHDYHEDYHDPLVPARSLAKLIVATTNVRVLYLFENSFEALYSTALPNFELPQFNRLFSLEFGCIKSDAGLKLLMAFLQSSPQLESLSFYLKCSDETWYPPTDVPFCILYNLKVIEVTYFRSLEPFLSMVTYLLEKTNSLEKLIIRQTRKNEEYIKKVLMLPRASKSCKIILT